MTKTKEVTYPVLPLHVFAQSEEENWFHVHIKTLYPFSDDNSFYLLLILLGPDKETKDLISSRIVSMINVTA